MSRGSGGGYDRHITIFSPEGRLFQSMILELLRLLGSPRLVFEQRLGLRCNTEEGPADARTLVKQARNEAAEVCFRYGYEMPIDVLARWYNNYLPKTQNLHLFV